jgi:hypothetical protein
MLRISTPTLPNAVVALILVSAVGVSALIDNAGAEDCLTGPNVSAPAGQHWYYRVDRVTHRRCWYLHAASYRVVHRALTVSTDAALEHPAAIAPAPPANDAMTPAVVADRLQSLPQITALAVKTISVPAVNVRIEQQAQRAAAKPAVRNAVAREYSATRGNAGEPTMFLLLVSGLGVAAFLTIAIKRAATHRGPALTDHPDAVWDRYRSQHWRRTTDPIDLASLVSEFRIG